MPASLTKGLTYMIYKGGNTSQPENYRPITCCLSLLYEILTSVMGQKKNILTSLILSLGKQNRCTGAHGCKELLIFDLLATHQAQTKSRNISMAWMTTERHLFDSVPCAWLRDVLKIYKIDESLISLFEQMMATWRTVKLSKSYNPLETKAEAEIKRGNFQGDSLSALWFCLSLNPLSKLSETLSIHTKLIPRLSCHVYFTWMI